MILKMKISTPAILLIILIILQFLLLKPFFHSGFFPTHDDVQTIRIFEYYQSLKFGAFPPRWSAGLLFGYGYPLFIFYSPLAYFAGAVFVLLGFNFLLATKIVFILGFFIGISGIFFLLKSLVGNTPAFIASIIYSLIPYRAVDVYVRGDLAEFFAYSFFPWVLWLNLKLLRNPKNIFLIYLFGISTALLILSHNISVFIYTIFLLTFNVFILKSEKENRLRTIRALSLSAVLSAALSCFYWLPLLIESQFVQLDKIANDYNQYFLTLSQIWQSPWGYGGFLQPNPMSLQLGQIIITISFLTLLLNIAIKTHLRKFIFFIEAVFIISTLFETKLTQFFWEQISLLHYLQFPWRLHILNTVCGVILVGFFFYLLRHLKIYHQKPGKFIFTTVGILLIFLSFKESFSFFKAKSFSEAKPAAVTTTGEEYLPKWVKFLPNSYPPDKIEFLTNKGNLADIKWGYSQKNFTSISDNNTRIRIAHIYYPGWEAYIDGRQTNISYNNKFALMEIDLPKGINHVTFIFQRTWWRWIADITSLVGIALVIFLSFISLITHRKKVELSK